MIESDAILVQQEKVSQLRALLGTKQIAIRAILTHVRKAHRILLQHEHDAVQRYPLAALEALRAALEVEA